MAPVVSICRDLLRIDTSNPGATEEPAVTYVADRLASAGIQIEVIEPAPGRCSLFARHRGQDPELPGLLVHCHLDVVPAEGTGWNHDPFGGVEEEGCLWGRGAVDMKNVASMMLATQCSLAESGEAPARNITFAYFADEEAGGVLGSKWAVENRPDLFNGINEAVGELGGFAVTLPGGRRVYPLQTAERGMLWLRIEVTGEGGHAALSDAPNPTVRIARLVERIAKLRLESPPRGAFGHLVRRLDELVGDVTKGDGSVLLELGSFGRMTLKAESASFTPTMLAAGSSVNAIPQRAEVYVDCRFVPGLLEEARAAVCSILDDDMSCDVLTAMPGLEVPAEGPFVEACQRVVDEYDPGASVVPWAVPAGTDAQRLSSLGIAGYGFAPLPLPAGFDHLELFHAVDERIPVDTLVPGYEMLRSLVTRY